MAFRFGPRDAAAWIRVPRADDDKYSRGVLGVVTGSRDFPGAAVLGVEAALRTGIGMVRYLGPGRARRLVLARRPEAVTVPGRVQAWLCGSGMPELPLEPGSLPEAVAARLDTVFAAATDAAQAEASGSVAVPVLLDAGALRLRRRASGPVLLTPHAGELAALLELDRADVLAHPEDAVCRAAAELDAVVLLKGATTRIATPAGELFDVSGAPAWLATAGTGDALAGTIGALIAGSAEAAADPRALAAIAASGAVLHALAAELAEGPFTVLGLVRSLPLAVRELLQVQASP